MKKLLMFPLLFGLLLAPLAFTGCAFFGTMKPAAIAEGQDPVVVQAERAQRSSLDVFRIVTKWEFANRVALPVDVSRAIDRYRAEFPPAWNESRLALKRYKEAAGSNPTALNSITAALLVAQESLLQLKKNASPNEVTQVTNALNSLVGSIRSFFTATPLPTAPAH